MPRGVAPLFDSFPRSWHWYQLIADQFHVCTALHLTFSGLSSSLLSLLSCRHPNSESIVNLLMSHLCIKPPHLVISPHWDSAVGSNPKNVKASFLWWSYCWPNARLTGMNTTSDLSLCGFKGTNCLDSVNLSLEIQICVCKSLFYFV